MDQHGRFALFINELEAAEPATDAQEARNLLERVLNEVEDRHSGVPFDPGAWRNDGRMYPPHDDFEYASAVAGVRLFKSKGHDIWFGSNGALRIARRGAGSVVIDKPGRDGGFVPMPIE